MASTRADLEGAFRLIYQAYLRSGLATSNRFGMRVTPYHLLSTTDVFLAKCRHEPICTASLVADGDYGLPMESVYADQVRQRRAAGLRLGEVTCLADRRRDVARFFPVFVRLARLLVQTARHRGLDQILVAVHPRHARFYERYLAFEAIGDERAYPHACGNPAVALCLDFQRADILAHTGRWDHSYQQFFGTRIPTRHMHAPARIAADQDHFRKMVDPRALAAAEAIQIARPTDPMPAAPSTAAARETDRVEHQPGVDLVP
ncbi:MAG: hypothetical protein GTO03_05965 [Planctomycetales bacterium]|nr:hypothetical protein [Planctomycetales bacterium]